MLLRGSDPSERATRFGRVAVGTTLAIRQAMQPFETLGPDALVTATGGKATDSASGTTPATAKLGPEPVWVTSKKGKTSLFEATKLGA